jgi:hypothetical protein
MPRRLLNDRPPPKPKHPRLATKLADELKAGREGGQPIIYETRYPTGLASATVIWDEWASIPDEERSETILRAYEGAEGPDAASKIALASGLTVPEAYAGGLLPYAVLTAWRKSDPVTLDECRRALEAEGASRLFGPDILQLRFATEEEAAEAVKRLSARLPGSELVWLVSRDVGAVAPSARAEDD